MTTIEGTDACRQESVDSLSASMKSSTISIGTFAILSVFPHSEYECDYQIKIICFRSLFVCRQQCLQDLSLFMFNILECLHDQVIPSTWFCHLTVHLYLVLSSQKLRSWQYEQRRWLAVQLFLGLLDLSAHACDMLSHVVITLI